MNQKGYPPQGTQGYGPGQTGFSAPQYTTPQVGFNQNAEPGYSQQAAPYGMPGGYAPQGLFSAPPQQTGYGMYPQQGGTGTFIPQTPYSPGYTSPDYQPLQPSYFPRNGYQQPGTYQQPAVNGYQAPQQGVTGGYQVPGGYQQPGAYQQPNAYQQPGAYQQQPGGYMPGYNPYGQMGRAPQQGQPQNPGIPLNGGGYVPQRVPVRRRGIEIRDWHLIAAGVALIALFVTAVLILKNVPLKILLILLAAGSAGFLWIRPLVDDNKRLTYSILALALCILTAVSFLMKPNTDNTTPREAQTESSGGENAPAGTGEQGVPEIPGALQPVQPAEETAEPDTAADRAPMERLVTFFSFWSGNRLDEMLDLCMPSWLEKQEAPRTSLFGLLANRTPVKIYPETISGTDGDTSRKVTIRAEIDHNNGKKAELYRMVIMMVKENNEWYVDPQSLQTNESLETPDPNITPAPTPTAEPDVRADTMLYYNPKGGEYYHLDPNCKIINPKFLPLGGSFAFGQINEDAYKNLKPCNVCGAPLRP